MKTIRFIMVFVAAAAMMFASCGKEDNNGDSNSGAAGNNTPTVVADNTLVYDGVTYQMEAEFAYVNNAMGFLTVHSVDTNADGEYRIRMPQGEIHLYAYLVGQEVDLTQLFHEWPGYQFALEGLVNWQLYAGDDGQKAMIGGSVEGDSYEDTPAVKHGTMKITIENGNFIFVLNAESKNNHTLALRIVTSANGWEPTVD